MFGKSALDLLWTLHVNQGFSLMADGTDTLFTSVAMAEQMCRTFDYICYVSLDVVVWTVEEVCEEKDV